MADSRFPQRRRESYEIKSDRTNKLVLSIMSQSDGTLITAIVSEMRCERSFLGLRSHCR
jgi:hypothetical protein